VTQRTDSNNLASVSGTISTLTNPIAGIHGTMDTGTTAMHAEGTVDLTCPPGGNGKGAGPGPQPAGNYRFDSSRDGAAFISPDFTRFIFVAAAHSIVVASPLSGGSSTSETLQVTVNFNDRSTFPPTFGFGCYLVDPTALTQNGVQSASLHVLLDSSTPSCANPFQQNNVPLPLTVDVHWTASGPPISLRDTSQTSCSTYTTESTTLNFGAVAANTFTLQPLFSDTFSSPDQGGLTTSDVTLHAQGVDPQDCIVRI
jgi:hypothetical protein